MRISKLFKKSESGNLWISARPAVAPYQRLTNPNFEVGLDRRASRILFQQPASP